MLPCTPCLYPCFCHVMLCAQAGCCDEARAVGLCWQPCRSAGTPHALLFVPLFVQKACMWLLASGGFASQMLALWWVLRCMHCMGGAAGAPRWFCVL
jgi:hypothetical protein